MREATNTMMIKLVIILVLVIGIVFLTVFALKSVFQPKQLSSIAKLIKQQRYAAAQKTAKAMIAKNPRDYIAHYYLGKAYLADKKNELALMEYKLVNQKAIFDGQIPEAEFRRQISQLYMKFNQTEDALKEFLLLTKLEPAVAENYFQVGKIYEQQNHPDQALGFYQKAIQLSPKHVKAHAACGLAYFRTKQVDKARKEIDTAIKLSPETASTYYYLGKILKEQKDYSGAVKAFEKSLRDPEFKQRALLERGSCYMAAGAEDNALAEFDKAVHAGKDDGAQETLYAHYFLAACYEKQRNLDKAIEHWQAIYKKNRSFRDVGAKLAEYKDLQTNDSLKEYLTCSTQEFEELCKKVALDGMGFSAQKMEKQAWGIRMLAVEGKKDDDWRSVRKQLFLMDFHRDTEPISDSEIRRVLDFSKSHNCAKAVVLTSSGFTSAASGFAENRPIELVGKERLEAILDKASI